MGKSSRVPLLSQTKPTETGQNSEISRYGHRPCLYARRARNMSSTSPPKEKSSG